MHPPALVVDGRKRLVEAGELLGSLADLRREEPGGERRAWEREGLSGGSLYATRHRWGRVSIERRSGIVRNGGDLG